MRPNGSQTAPRDQKNGSPHGVLRFRSTRREPLPFSSARLLLMETPAHTPRRETPPRSISMHAVPNTSQPRNPLSPSIHPPGPGLTTAAVAIAHLCRIVTSAYKQNACLSLHISKPHAIWRRRCYLLFGMYARLGRSKEGWAGQGLYMNDSTDCTAYIMLGQEYSTHHGAPVQTAFSPLLRLLWALTYAAHHWHLARQPQPRRHCKRRLVPLHRQIHLGL